MIVTDTRSAEINESIVKTNIAKRLLILVLAIGASACITVTGTPDEDALKRAGATRLSPDQVKAHVTGKTEEWQHGGAYYGENGELKVIWRKVFSNGSWMVSDDGTLCYQVPRWEERCHFYMKHEGKIIVLEDQVNQGIWPLHDGDRLAALGRYNSNLNRLR